MKVLILTIAVLAFSGCSKEQTPDATSASATTSTAAPDTSSAAEKTYPMNGKLVSRDATKNEAVIDNEEIPGGVMAKMTMGYELRGARVDSLPPDGSMISSTLHEQNSKYWVTDVKLKQ